jgi:hypothetical protein
VGLGIGGTSDVLDDVRVAGIGNAEAADAEELTTSSTKIDVV